MRILKGTGVCGGIAFGKLYLFSKTEKTVKRTHVEDTESEISRFEKAQQEALEQLEALHDKALAEVGEANAMIFEIHQMMLCDEDYLNSIRSIISDQGINAETAVAVTADNFAEMFSSMDDEYMKERAADVKDISERVIGILSGAGNVGTDYSEPVIIAAEDLAPSETVQLDKSKILAFVTEKGSSNSHTSILARTMNIPAVVGVEGLMDGNDGMKDAIVDGGTGTIYIEPDETTVSQMREKREDDIRRREMLDRLKNVNPVTKDGQEILLYANIGTPDDLPLVYANGGQGVGLFRSEFIYLESDHYPTEDEQFAVYKKSLEKMAGKCVVIRTLDIGADKQVDYFDMPNEENPAMGVRAIRICLNRPEIFRTQLRALLRASAYGKLAIMFPMITSVDEVKRIKAIVEDVKSELRSEEIKFDENIELGIMIETPAAAIVSDRLAKEVDFFSVGTNDLTQYTLAIDRQNSEAEKFCDTHHESILRFIKIAADNAHANGIWIGICGELGADISLTEFFLSIGIDELSVSPGKIPELKNKVIETDVTAVKGRVGEYLKY